MELSRTKTLAAESEHTACRRERMNPPRKRQQILNTNACHMLSEKSDDVKAKARWFFKLQVHGNQPTRGHVTVNLEAPKLSQNQLGFWMPKSKCPDEHLKSWPMAHSPNKTQHGPPKTPTQLLRQLKLQNHPAWKRNRSMLSYSSP